MIEYFNLSIDAKYELTEEGHMFRYESRTVRALSDLTTYGNLLHRPRRAYYEITDAGRKELERSNETITLYYLQKNYPKQK